MNAISLPPSGRQLFDELQLRPYLRLQVGEHVIDVGALRVLTRPGSPRLSGKSLAVLIELARHSGVTLTRGQLLERVWAERVTTPDVLTQAIVELRRTFADDVKAPRYIETVPRVGYRLLAAVTLLDSNVQVLSENALVEEASNDLEPQTPDVFSIPSPLGRPGFIPIWMLLTLIATGLLMAFGLDVGPFTNQ